MRRPALGRSIARCCAGCVRAARRLRQRSSLPGATAKRGRVRRLWPSSCVHVGELRGASQRKNRRLAVSARQSARARGLQPPQSRQSKGKAAYLGRCCRGVTVGGIAPEAAPRGTASRRHLRWLEVAPCAFTSRRRGRARLRSLGGEGRPASPSAAPRARRFATRRQSGRLRRSGGLPSRAGSLRSCPPPPPMPKWLGGWEGEPQPPPRASVFIVAAVATQGRVSAPLGPPCSYPPLVGLR